MEKIKTVLNDKLYDPNLLSEFTHHPMVHELVELSKEMAALQEKQSHSHLFDRHYGQEQGLPFFQLEEFANNYKAHPPRDEGEEFYKLFGRRGIGLVEEVEKIHTFLKDLKTHPSFFRYYFNRIQSPLEILSQTARAENRGILPWK